MFSWYPTYTQLMIVIQYLGFGSIKDKHYSIQYCIEIESKYYTCNRMGRHHLNLLDLLELVLDMENASMPIIVI